MPRLTRILSLLGLTALLSGCVVESANTFIDAKSARPDARLTGRWDYAEEDGYVRFDAGTDQQIRLFFFKEGETDGGRNPLFLARTAEVNGQWYMSLTIADRREGIDGHIFVRYIVEGDRMKFWLMDKEKVRKAIAGGRLKGGEASYGGVRLTSPATELLELVTRLPAEDLFSYEGELKRSAKK